MIPLPDVCHKGLLPPAITADKFALWQAVMLAKLTASTTGKILTFTVCAVATKLLPLPFTKLGILLSVAVFGKVALFVQSPR